MSSGYSGRVWTCPFFRWDGSKEVHCEGGCVAFRNGETFGTYAQRFCANVTGWSRCTLAKALVEEYEKGVNADVER